jgi:hypothetical protein
MSYIQQQIAEHFAEIYLSGRPIPDGEITEWLLDAKDYVEQLEASTSERFRAVGRLIKAAVLIIEQLQRAAGADDTTEATA